MRADLLDKVDVLVIGGGVAGCTALREISKFKYDVALVEKHGDVCCECSKAAAANMHAPTYAAAEVGVRPDFLAQGVVSTSTLGFDMLSIVTYAMFERFYKDLGVKLGNRDYLLVAFNNKQLEMLKKARYRVRCLSCSYEFTTDVKRIRELEPNISHEVIGALVLPIGGMNPWEIVIAIYENARQNGARAHFNAEVMNIVWQKDKENFLVETERGDIETGYIVNAAGFGAAELARMIGDDSFVPYGTRQEFIILDNTCKGIVNNTVREMGENGAFGNFVTPCVDGEILLGRGYFPCETEEDFSNVEVTRRGIEITTAGTKKLIPSLPISEAAISTYAGVLPAIKVKTPNGYLFNGLNPIIAPSENNPRFVNLTFPGVCSAPAIGLFVQQALNKAGLVLGRLEEKDNFNPIRPPILRRFSGASHDERARLIDEDPLYGHVVCRCMNVTEAEIVEAIRRGATTYAGVKKRTHTGMGRCQGGFDKPRVLAILARELGIPQTELTIKGGTSIETMFTSKELLKGEIKRECLTYVEPRFDSEELKKSYGKFLEELKDD
jgi:glycerol-3-phosphate dehydrogenase